MYEGRSTALSANIPKRLLSHVHKLLKRSTQWPLLFGLFRATDWQCLKIMGVTFCNGSVSLQSPSHPGFSTTAKNIVSVQFYFSAPMVLLYCSSISTYCSTLGTIGSIIVLLQLFCSRAIHRNVAFDVFISILTNLQNASCQLVRFARVQGHQVSVSNKAFQIRLLYNSVNYVL